MEDDRDRRTRTNLPYNIIRCASVLLFLMPAFTWVRSTMCSRICNAVSSKMRVPENVVVGDNYLNLQDGFSREHISKLWTFPQARLYLRGESAQWHSSHDLKIVSPSFALRQGWLSLGQNRFRNATLKRWFIAISQKCLNCLTADCRDLTRWSIACVFNLESNIRYVWEIDQFKVFDTQPRPFVGHSLVKRLPHCVPLQARKHCVYRSNSASNPQWSSISPMFKIIFGVMIFVVGWFADSLGFARLDQGSRFSGISLIFVGLGSISGGFYIVLSAVGLT